MSEKEGERERENERRPPVHPRHLSACSSSSSDFFHVRAASRREFRNGARSDLSLPLPLSFVASTSL